jgi:hypothetical protein
MRTIRKGVVVTKWFSFTNHPNADFVDFATQRNGGRGHEKDLLGPTHSLTTGKCQERMNYLLKYGIILTEVLFLILA